MTLPIGPDTAQCDGPDLSARPVAETLTVPGVSGIKPMKPGWAGPQRRGASAWAEAGWYVLPTDNYGFTGRDGERVETIKRPGSIVGRRWYDKSTRNPEYISEIWGFEYPWAGIVADCGTSGAVVFDFDDDCLDDIADPAIRAALRSCEGRQYTRRNSERGHYPFLLRRNPDGTLAELYGDTAGAFAPYGDVRCNHGVIVVAPTPHPDGGCYTAIPGPVTPLPDALRRCLGLNLLLLDGGTIPTAPMSDAELDDFLGTNNRYGNTMHLIFVVRKFHARVDDGESRHRALIGCLSWAFEESRCGHYPATMALHRLAEAFAERFGGPGVNGKRATPDRDEVLNAAKWAAASALQIDPADRIARRKAKR